MGRKKLNNIRIAEVGGNKYYVYDLEEDSLGKRKRIYAKTEGELKEKIEQAKAEKDASLLSQIPKTDDLKTWVIFFLKVSVGKYAAPIIKRWAKISENAIYSSQINKNISEISPKEIKDFILSSLDVFPEENVKDLEQVLRGVFEISNRVNRTKISFPEIEFPEEKSSVSEKYYMTETELDILLKFCLLDDCKKYSKKELVITLALFTGIKCSDLLKLTRSDFCLNQSYIQLGERQVPLSKTAVEWLEEQERRGVMQISTYRFDPETCISTRISDGTEPVFCFDGKMIISSNVQHTLRLLLVRCGLPKGITMLTIHKSFMVNEIKRGVPVDVIAKRYGYSQKSLVNMLDEAEISFMLRG